MHPVFIRAGFTPRQAARFQVSLAFLHQGSIDDEGDFLEPIGRGSGVQQMMWEPLIYHEDER